MSHLYNIENADVYDNLRKILSLGDLVLFAGSGLSAQASTDEGDHPPIWKKLLKDMVKWCVDKGLIDSKEACNVEEAIDRGFFIEAGQELQEIIQEPTLLQQCLGDSLLVNRANISESHSLIVRLPFRAYLTTNYDDFIEGAFWSERGKRLEKFYEPTLESIMNAFRNKEPFIFKLHGDISDPRSIVFGYRSYDRLQSSYNYRSCLEAIFAMSSVLFIGFSGTDPDLEGIVNRVAALDGRIKRHWMLMPKDAVPILKAKRMWKDKGINVVQYEADQTHSGLVQFLRALAIPPSLTTTTREKQDEVKSFERRIKIDAT